MSSSTLPFKVAAAKAVADPARQFMLFAQASELDGYLKVFEDYGYSGNGHSWREHLETIIEEFAPELLDHLEFAEDDDNFVAYADSPDAVRQFMACALPYFGDLGKLNKYLGQTDPGNFFA
ncbi:MAG: Imm51 family immunity protein [Janthinobacterium lividum]